MRCSLGAATFDARSLASLLSDKNGEGLGRCVVEIVFPQLLVFIYGSAAVTFSQGEHCSSWAS